MLETENKNTNPHSATGYVGTNSKGKWHLKVSATCYTAVRKTHAIVLYLANLITVMLQTNRSILD
jgi:hypothetical protein